MEPGLALAGVRALRVEAGGVSVASILLTLVDV